MQIQRNSWSRMKLTRKTSTLCWRPNLDYRISTPFAIHYQFHQNALFIVSRVLFKIFYFCFRQIKLECVLWLNSKKTKFWKFWPDFVNSNLKRGFIKGKVIRLLRTNSSEINFQEAISSFKTRLQTCGYPKQLVEKTVSEVTFNLPEGSRLYTNKI